MSIAIWSLAAQNVSLYPFGPWRDKCPLIHLAPGVIKCFIVPFGPWRDKMFHYTLLVPGGKKCFIVPFGPWRDKMFHYTIVRLAA